MEFACRMTWKRLIVLKIDQPVSHDRQKHAALSASLLQNLIGHNLNSQACEIGRKSTSSCREALLPIYRRGWATISVRNVTSKQDSVITLTPNILA